MATLNIKVFEDIVSDMAVAIQASANTLIDFSIGSILRAISESNATLALWLQGLALQLLTTVRAATSAGADLDSWCLDFNFFRLPAVTASGIVTFARFTPTNAAFIPVGTIVQTADATAEQFIVIPDATNAYYSAALGGFTIPAGIGSIQCAVTALASGSVGNAQAGTVALLTGAVSGVDTVTNPNAFTNGVDPESDAALRARFVAYIGSLAQGTKTSIGNAIMSVQSGVAYTLTENQNYAGAAQYGYFYVVADDGSGSPPLSFLNAVYAAIDTVRGFSITFGVFAPLVTSATVAMTITSTNHTADAAAVQSAITAYIQALGIGQSLPYSRLAQIAYDTSSTITNVQSVTLNGSASDLVVDAKHRIMTSSVTAS